MTRSRTVRRLTAAILTLGLFSTLSVAQPPRTGDPLAEARLRKQIDDQKAESEVREAIATADRQAKNNPAKAVQTLKAAQTNIDLAVALSNETRKSLTDLLQRKIAAVEGRPLAVASGPKADPKAATVKYDKRAAEESASAEIKTINDGIRKIVRYHDSGLTREANQELAALAKAYPNNPAVLSLQEKGSFKDRVEDARQFTDQMQKRVTLALRDTDRSALPAMGDIEFPKDWKEKTARRVKGVQLTAKEQKIIEALDKPISVNWNNKMLEEALQELSTATGLDFFIDKKALKDLGLELNKPATLQANGVATRTVLRQVLAAQGLTFVMKDEVIQVTDVERAREMLVTRVYYLGDIVQGAGPFGGAPQWGTFLDYQQTMANVEVLVKSITSSIEPLSWKERSGPGTITFHYPTMSIIVRASAEVHATLGAKIGGGR